MLEIQSVSVVVGSKACNANCPFCVAKMTPGNGLDQKEIEINERNFIKLCDLAVKRGAETLLITGKGEPTLYLDQISDVLWLAEKHKFPKIDLQTNGIVLARMLRDKPDEFDELLTDWYDDGLTTIALSIVHFDPAVNKSIYCPQTEYFDLPTLIKAIKRKDINVRLSVIAFKGGIDSAGKVDEMVEFERETGADELTINPVNFMPNSQNPEVEEWVKAHLLSDQEKKEMFARIHEQGKPMLNLAHGATVYSYKDKNVCLSTCLTHNPDPSQTRQLILMPDGHVYYDWTMAAAKYF